MQTPAAPRPAHVARTVSSLLEAGYQALSTEDHVRAEQLFRRAVQLDPLSAPAWRALADTQIGARRRMCLRWVEFADARRPPPPIVSAARRQLTPAWWAFRVAAATASVTLLLTVGSDVAYRNKVLPGVSVGGLDMSNLTRAAGARALRQRHAELAQRTIMLQAGDQTVAVPLRRVLLDHTGALLNDAFRYGHEPSFIGRAAARLRALAGFEHVVPEIAINSSAVEQVVDEFGALVSREQRPARLLHSAAGWQTMPEQLGAAINRQQVVTDLVQQIHAVAMHAAGPPPTVEVSLLPIMPAQTAAEIKPIQQQLAALAAQPLMVRSGDRSWTLDRSMLMDIHVGAGPSTVRPSSLLISQQVERIAQELAVAPQPSQLIRDGTRIRAMVQGRPGRELDQATALQQIMHALQDGAPQIDLALREVPPPPGEAEQLGLIAELGRGESQFLTYSSPARDANVQAGGNEIDGVLIAPGEVFSFTRTIGDITWEEGYRWGEMIEAGIVVPSLGGGICQVSTTVFRAAFWSGLEIVERHNHSWRLPWYEVDAPPGMDATIALGGPDLKLRNNTQHHVLLKVETDLEHKRQTVILYGTPDGRQVSMQAVAGGNIGVQRHVKQSDGQVAAETYLSYYSQ